MTLLDLAPSQVGRIISLGGNPEFISRLMEMGFHEGIKVRMIQEILGGLILIVALVMIAMRFKKQVTVGEGNHQCDDC